MSFFLLLCNKKSHNNKTGLEQFFLQTDYGVFQSACIYIYPIKFGQSINADGFLRVAITSTFALYQNLVLRSRKKFCGSDFFLKQGKGFDVDKPKLKRLKKEKLKLKPVKVDNSSIYYRANILQFLP